MSVNIHGKAYITVAERLTQAHKELKQLDITTEVLFIDPRVVIKATVVTPKGTFTGISAANVGKTIEKESPYEVAETSAVGRALAFAGYETTEIASAEEMNKALKEETKQKQEGCEHLKTSKHQVSKEGANKGKWFLGCDNCKAFIGWTEAPDKIIEKTGHDFDEDFSTIH